MSLLSSRRRFPPLNALRAFEAAARHLSFKDAADELSVSQSAVSHQVKALEDALGLALFTRRTRAVELTRKGRLYYPIVRNAFENIADGTKLILQETSTDILTLHVYATFAIRWLLPRLVRFEEKHPEVQLRLHTSQSDVNLDQNDIDASIMIGQAKNSDLHYDLLFDAEMFPVCSKRYLDRHAELSTPQDLEKHALLQVYPSASDWRVWLDANDVEGVNPESGLQFESYEVALTSARQGMGIALAQQPFISQDLMNSELVEIFPGKRLRNPARWFLVCRSDKRALKKLETFKNWLLEEVEADPQLRS